MAEAAGIRVRALSDADAPRWTGFVASRREASLYQTLAWRDVVSRVFGHTPRYCIAERGEQVVGVLPAFEVRNPILGSKLISMPYDIGSGGALTTDEEASHLLTEATIELARTRGVGWLECRTGVARSTLDGLGFTKSEPVIQSELSFSPGVDPWKTVSNDHRQSVRRAAKRGVTVREAKSKDDFNAYYGVYLRAFRDFGTPAYGRNYFPALFDMLHADGSARVLLAEAEGKCVGGMLLFCWQKNWVNKIGSVLPEAVSMRVFAALYGYAIDLAVRSGVERLSLGTSSKSQAGLIDFKERWGAKSYPAVVYQMAIRKQPPSLERYYDETGLAQRMWRRLPVALTPLLGGPLNRWFC